MLIRFSKRTNITSTLNRFIQTRNMEQIASTINTTADASLSTEQLNEQLQNLKLGSINAQDIDISNIVVPTAGKDPNVPQKNKAVTKPIELNSATGEVLVRKATGKTKLRKGQSEEEYQAQRKIYLDDHHGPVRKEEGWLGLGNDNIPLDVERQKECVTDKQLRAVLNQRVNLLYYQKKYDVCEKLTQQLLSVYTSEPHFIKLCKKDISDLEHLRELCQAKLKL